MKVIPLAQFGTRSFQQTTRTFRQSTCISVMLMLLVKSTTAWSRPWGLCYRGGEQLYSSLSGRGGSSKLESTTTISTVDYSPLTRPHAPIHQFGGIEYRPSTSLLFRTIFVLGGPGAGKGTQSALMQQHFPVVHLSVGDLLRAEQSKPETPHRQVLDEALVHGTIVPVEVSLGLLQAAMQEKANEMGNDILFLVDGFPRNYDNLNGWTRVMENVAVLSSVLFYTCPLAVLEQRILQRGKESGRADDNLQSLQKRFQTFEHETMPVIETLRELSKQQSTSWKVMTISGNQPLDDVWLDSQQALNQLIFHDVITANAKLLDSTQAGDVDAYEALCDPEWFVSLNARDVMKEQEGEPAPTGDITRAQLDVITGKHVAVSYDRVMQGQPMREKRIWSHKGKGGWRNVHFSRTPQTDQQI